MFQWNFFYDLIVNMEEYETPWINRENHTFARAVILFHKMSLSRYPLARWRVQHNFTDGSKVRKRKIDLRRKSQKFNWILFYAHFTL